MLSHMELPIIGPIHHSELQFMSDQWHSLTQYFLTCFRFQQYLVNQATVFEKRQPISYPMQWKTMKHIQQKLQSERLQEDSKISEHSEDIICE